jgi:hypothetical protein
MYHRLATSMCFTPFASCVFCHMRSTFRHEPPVFRGVPPHSPDYAGRLGQYSHSIRANRTPSVNLPVLLLLPDESGSQPADSTHVGLGGPYPTDVHNCLYGIATLNEVLRIPPS